MNKLMLSAFSVVTGAVIGTVGIGKIAVKTLNNTQGTANKYRFLYEMMNDWVRIKQEGKNLSSYFKSMGYKNIAIYGMGIVGETLVNELMDTDTKIAYGIDKSARAICTNVEAFSVDDELEEVDAVVVTPVPYFVEIEEMLSKKLRCPIISLEDVLYDTMING
jgi:hypothetical protein